MNKEEFINALKKLEINITPNQLNQLDKYYKILIKENNKYNLTSITDEQSVYLKHFYDSLTFSKMINLDSQSLCDIGTGAGFPGIPLKIAFPQLEITLMDSLNKRINFLNEVIEKLGLKKITAVHGRAEEMARKKEYREAFDLCVSRAVANLSSLSEYCLPFVKKDGCFVSYKSAESDQETVDAKNAIFLLGGKLGDIVKYQVPGSDMGRALVKIEKVKQTPKAYPRKAGTPSKEPL